LHFQFFDFPEIDSHKTVYHSASFPLTIAPDFRGSLLVVTPQLPTLITPTTKK
jgi:hypothetical protein